MLRIGVAFVTRKNHKWKIYRYPTANLIKAYQWFKLDRSLEDLEV